jgi:xanthine dehydrogenase accessory factor
MNESIFAAAARNQEQGRDFVMVTVIDASGSIPGKPGARMLVRDDDIDGTVGGGALEKRAVEKSREMLAAGTGSPERVSWKTEELDMACGGATDLFFEPFFGPEPLWIFGGGHIAEQLVPLAARIGFSITVVDNREVFSRADRFPGAARALHCEDYTEVAEQVPDGAYVIVVTHGHMHDQDVLLALARRTPALPYIGMIGSRRKVPVALEHLRDNGVEPGPNIYAPIGLRLGGGTPAEIALAIAAEIQGLRSGETDLPHMRVTG